MTGRVANNLGLNDTQAAQHTGGRESGRVGECTQEVHNVILVNVLLVASKMKKSSEEKAIFTAKGQIKHGPKKAGGEGGEGEIM